jgi:hypothetical protein
MTPTTQRHLCLFCHRYTLSRFNSRGMARCPLCRQYTMRLSQKEAPAQYDENETLQRETLLPEIEDAFAKVLLPQNARPGDLYDQPFEIDYTYWNGITYISLWLPRKMLTTTDVAKILEVSVDWVGRMAAKGKFPGATRGEPTRAEYHRGRWLIPLQDVHDILIDMTEPASSRWGEHNLYDIESKLSMLLDLAMDAESHLGHHMAEGLAFPIPLIDQLIIANARLELIRGLDTGDGTLIDDRPIKVPDIVVSHPRAYLSCDNTTLLSLTLSPEDVDRLFKHELQFDLWIEELITAYGGNLEEEIYELWILRDSHAMLREYGNGELDEDELEMV